MATGAKATPGRPKPRVSTAGHTRAKHAIVKHSLLVAGHRTSVSLEDAFWIALKRVAAERAVSVAALVAEVDAGRGDANLSSAIRVFLLETRLPAADRDLQ